MKNFRLYFPAVALFVIASTSLAQITTKNPPQPEARSAVVSSQSLPVESETYGTSAQIKLHIPGASLTAIDANTVLTDDGQAQFYNAGTNAPNGRLVAGVNLPSGAIIQRIDLYYDDTDAGLDVFATLYTTEGTTTNVLGVVGTATSTGSAGKGVASSTALSHVVVNDNRQYQLFVFDTSSNKKVRAVAIIYKLQISPDPATATFADVPVGHPFHRFVEAIAASGITGGCGGTPPNYCPDAPITRGQMAVFLAGALGLHWAP